MVDVTKWLKSVCDPDKKYTRESISTWLVLKYLMFELNKTWSMVPSSFVEWAISEFDNIQLYHINKLIR